MEKRPKITVLLLTTEYHDHIIGGLGRHVTDLTLEGVKQGINYIVVTVSKTSVESYSVEDGVHVYRLLPWQRKPKDLLEYIQNVNFRFSQFVLQELHLSFDLIHVHDWLTGIAGSQLKAMLKLPLLTTIHSTESGRKLGEVNTIINRITDIESNIVLVSDQIIVCSLFMKDVLINEIGCPLSKIQVIPNGIIPENYQSVMSEEEVIKTFSFISSTFLLAMGRLVKEKGFHLLIHAFSDIHDYFPNYNLVIAGEGPYENELKKLTNNLHLEKKVFFPGFVKDLKRNTLLKNCKMLVIPSLYEPFGIIALEGMMAAKPTVGYNIGGLAETLAENRGILVGDITFKSLAETLLFYLSHPDQHRKIVMKGFEAANNKYNWTYLIDETIDVYIKMVKNKKGKSKNKI